MKDKAMKKTRFLFILSSLFIIELNTQAIVLGHPKTNPNQNRHNKSLSQQITKNKYSTHDIPEMFERKLYTNSPNIDQSRNIRSQISELMGVSEGNDYAGFGYPDQTSNEDSIDTRNLYQIIMKSQYREKIIKTKDIDSPFGL